MATEAQRHGESSHFARVSVLLIGMGVLGAVRLLSELLQVSDAKFIYWIVLAVDAGLATAMILAGVGLRQGDSRATPLALLAGGAVLASSIGWGAILAHEVFPRLKWPLNGTAGILLPRMVFYGIVLALQPYIAWDLIARAPQESRKPLWGCFWGSFVLGAACVGTLFLWQG